MRHLDLFAGIGGFSLAAHWMGWETVAQVEWDEWCQKVLAKNFPNALRFGDIVEFNNKLENGEIIADTESCRNKRECRTMAKEENYSKEQNDGAEFNGVGKDELPSVGRIDIITGGFPCQPFSHAGKRKGVADERYLWPEMLRTIRILKPSFVVGENVAGLVSMENGKTLDAILADLENEGYQVESFIIPACAVGAWHRRDRIWIIGYRTMSNTKCGQQGQDRCCVGLNGEGRTSLQAENEGWEGETIQHRELDDVQRDDPHSSNLRNGQLGESSGQCENGIESEEQKSRTQHSKQPDQLYEPGKVKDVSNTPHAGCQAEREQSKSTTQSERVSNSSCRDERRPTQCSLGGMAHGLPPGMDGYFDKEPEGVPRVATGVKDRVNRLKGLGNAIVPQVVFEVFRAIEKYNYTNG